MLVGENTYSELFYAVLILQMYTTWVLPEYQIRLHSSVL